MIKKVLVVIKLVLRILFGLLFINAGLNKFFNYMPAPEMPQIMMDTMQSLMSLVWMMPLVAIVEIVGGGLFLFRKTLTLGAIVIFPVVIGILMIHIFQAPAGLPMALILLLINLWAIFERKDDLLGLIKED